MKKGKKLLVLSTLLGITIGTGGVMQYHDTLQKVYNEKIMAYKNNATNVLENVYTRNGQKILPIILENSDERVIKDKIIGDFKAKGLTIKGNIPQIITTGTKLVTTNNETYNVVVFGDIDNSGEIDISDSHKILEYCIGEAELSENYLLAANVYNNDDEIDISDSHRILEFCIGEENILLNPPASDAENNVITKVELVAQPTKRTYNYGESINLSGAKIKVTKVSGKTETIDVTTNMISGYNPEKVGEQTVTVTYGGKTATFKVTVKEKDIVTGITIKTQPTKTTYDFGQDINVTGGTLTVTYKSGKTATVNITSNMITGYNKTKLGEQTVTVTYEGKTTVFKVNVKDVITKIAIKTQPTNKEYNWGQSINVAGGVLTVTYKSGKTATVNMTNDMISNYNSKKEGEQTVTVTYGGKTATFKVNVKDVITKIAMKTEPTKKTYNYGQDIDVTGGVITVTYTSGKTKPVPITKNMISGYNAKYVEKAQTVTVTYGGKTTTFNVTVKDVVDTISMNTLPTKLTYSIGEPIKVTGGVITINYKSGKIKTEPIKDTMIKGYDSNSAGTKTVTVTYEGKTTTFTVTVEDNIKEIAIEKLPTKTTYNYGQDIDVTGGKIKVTKVSGETQIVEITTNMISGYNPTPNKENITNHENKQNVTVTYGGKTTTYRVTVKDVVKNIEIVTKPTKLTYEVGEAIELAGGKIKVTYESTITETEEITSNMIKGYDSSTAGTKTVTVTYGGKQTTFTVTVEEPQQEDYIKKFEITTEPKKREYVVGDDIETAGMVVKVTKVSGTVTNLDLTNLTISTDINNPYVSNTKVAADTKTVTVSYKANNEAGEITTFSDTFEITVVKPIENIKVTKGTTTGYMYDILSAVATVESGEGELDITVDNLEWEVQDSKGNVIKDSAGTITNNEIEVTLEPVQFTNKVAINFRALREGTYILIPKVGEKRGQNVEITIDANNPIVTRIELGAIENENKFRIGQTRDVSVEFVHEYETNVERTIPVEARRVTIQINGKVATEGKDYSLLDSTGRIINLSTNPNDYVAKIRLIGTSVGQKTIDVYVDKGESGKEAKATKTVIILAEAKVFVKIAETDKSMNLYTTMPEVIGENEILETYNNSIYTLVRVWLEDEDGKITKITSNNITSLKTETGKVQLIDTKYDAGTLPMALVTYKLYKGTKGNIEPTEPDEGADYIGITMVNNAAELLRNERIIIRYGASSEEINIDIPRSEISSIKVTNGTTRGYCLQPIQVGTVKSGTNQMPITPENLEWEVQDGKGNVIKNSNGTVTNNTINVQVGQAQMAETVAIEFTAQEKGTYKIIPKIGNVYGTAIEVTIEDSPIVTRIGLGDIDGKLRVGKRKELNIQFFHSYNENDERPIQVEANRITIEINGVKAVAGTDYELMQYDEVNKVNKIINIANEPTATVEKIQLIGTTVGEKIINIYVDKDTEAEEMATKTVTVEEQAQPTLTTDAQTIKLYTTMPDSGTLGEGEKVELGTDGTTPYTLIKIWLDADGEQTNITRADITNSIVEAKYLFQTMEMPFQLDVYKEVDGVISRAEGNEPVTYLGIALFTGGSNIIKDNDKCLLKYNGNTIKEITIKK